MRGEIMHLRVDEGRCGWPSEVRVEIPDLGPAGRVSARSKSIKA